MIATTSSVAEVELEQASWRQLQWPLFSSYPRPPRDVFERVVAASHQSQCLWLASDADGVVGLVMFNPHSKGGHLENLAVAPSAQGRGIVQ